jgi:CRP-like cAMP-binding protein
VISFCLNASNVLYLASYVVRDILWLRGLTVVGGILAAAYFLLLPDVAWNAIAWIALFTLINVVQIVLLLVDRRPVQLSDDAERLHELAFSALTRRELAKLLAIARWESVAAGTRLVTRGEDVNRLMVVVSGRARVERSGHARAELGPGRLIGEMSFVTGKSPTADVVAVEHALIVSWPKDALQAFLAGNPELAVAVERVIGADLARKLEAASSARAPSAPRPPRGPVGYLASSNWTSRVVRLDIARSRATPRLRGSRRTPGLAPGLLTAAR